MKAQFSRRLKEWLALVLTWTFLTMLFSGLIIGILRYFVLILEIPDFTHNNELAWYMASNYQLLEALIFGVLFGTMFFLVNIFTDDTHLQRKAFGKIILIKSGLYLLSLILVSLIISSIFISFDIISFDLARDFNLWQNNPWLLLLFTILLVFFIIVINFFQVVNKKFGPGQTIAIILGKYHTPKIEQRIFMFLDLKSSTTYAEQLGHLKYSLLIQDCFFDLNRLLVRHRAEVYQYVGDEAVLTWNYSDGLRNGNCVRLFFSYQKLLQKRTAYYSEKYGLVPEFKAGLNGGEITVAEVGNIKKEIAYHGDVLNTAARIRDLCSQIDRQILLTDHLAQHLMIVNHFNYQAEGAYKLRGKGEQISVYSAQEPVANPKALVGN